MNDPVWPMSALFGLVSGGMAGAIAGSFLATLAIRWGHGASIVQGRSRCDGCRRGIPAYRLVPLASFLLLGGRAACCGMRIDRRHIAMESVCACIGALACGLRPDVDGIAGALFGWVLAVLALLDRDHLWLPDRLTGTLAMLGLASGAIGLSPAMADRLIGGIAGWGALAAIGFAYARVRQREGLGMGDAKLLGAIGIWLGWRVLPWVVLGASLIGLCWVAASRLRGTILRRDDALPFGTLLAMAAWPAWMVSALLSGT